MWGALLLMSMQASGQAATAVLPDDPDTWVLEYPAIIAEDVAEYYGCLKSRGTSASAENPDVFEEQHRAHVPQCIKQLEQSMQRANGALAGRKGYSKFTPDRIAATFKTVEYIHIARGRDLDNRLRLHLSEHETYDRAYQQTPEEVSGGERLAADLPSTTSQDRTSQDTINAEN